MTTPVGEGGRRPLVLYHTAQCHLCEEAAAMCAAVLNPVFFEVRQVDIVNDDALVERYGVRIPVLRDVERATELGWPFDIEQLIAFLS